MQQRREVFEVPERIGLFATLYYVIAIRRSCEERGIEPWIAVTNPMYVDPQRGDDWLDYYFERRGASERPGHADAHHRIRSRRALNRLLTGRPFHDYSRAFRDLREARTYFDRYLRIKPELRDAAQAFAQEHFGEPTLGIHWRATDKAYDEADPISLDLMEDVLRRHGAGMSTFFVATDDAEFPDWVRARFSDKHVVSFSTPTGRAWSEDTTDNYRKGRDAILDCLLLSHCDRLVKTPSVLSAWSKVLNLDLPVVLVGRPYKQFMRWRVRMPWGKVRFDRFRAQPLPLLGYYPESALYDDEPTAMARNGVLEIVAESRGPVGSHYY